MFGIGWPELFVLGVVGVVLVGPERLPTVARDVGAGVRRLRQLSEEARQVARRELGDDLPQVNVQNIADWHPRELVRKHLIDPLVAGSDAAPTAIKPTTGPEE